MRTYFFIYRKGLEMLTDHVELENDDRAIEYGLNTAGITWYLDRINLNDRYGRLVWEKK